MVALQIECVPGSRSPRQQRSFARAYIREWLDHLGVRPVELVRAEIINEGYLSQLRSGQKTRPSIDKVAAIAEFLGVHWTDLYKPPPNRDIIREISTLHPDTVERIRRSRPR